MSQSVFRTDGDVDGADFLTWQRGDSPSGATSGDLAERQSNFGTVYSTISTTEAILEPSALPLILLGIGCLSRLGRSQESYKVRKQNKLVTRHEKPI